ncbi:MAG: sigma factor [Pirellulaceae bacterium]
MDSLDVLEVRVGENSGMSTAFIRLAVSGRVAVDDVWQETMLTAWRIGDDDDRSCPFGAWLRGIAAKNILAWNR